VFRTPMTVAAWQTKPSWAIVAAADKIINPDTERMWYTRARSRITTIPGVGHDVYEARPREVAAVIEDAARHAVPSARGIRDAPHPTSAMIRAEEAGSDRASSVVSAIPVHAQAATRALFVWMNASRSLLTRSFNVAGSPCGAPL